MMKRLPESVRAHVALAGECWLWTAASSRGYGYLSFGGQRWRAHRFAYEHLVGPVPDGLVLDHLCRNTLCLNPAHLEPVTQRENLRRGESPVGINAQRTHCSQGHEFTPENIMQHGGDGRRCRECARTRTRAWKRRKSTPTQQAIIGRLSLGPQSVQAISDDTRLKKQAVGRAMRCLSDLSVVTVHEALPGAQCVWRLTDA